MIFNLSDHSSVANIFISELRDAEVQKDRLRFRRNVERLGEIMAYEVSKELKHVDREVTTPLGKAKTSVPEISPVLLTILRAGLPFFQGFLNMFDRADCGFIGAYREEAIGSIQIKLDYIAIPDIEDKVIVLIDPMLATGRSILDSIQWILKKGKPKHIHIVSLIAAPEGIDYLSKKIEVSHKIWTCALDERINNLFYIVPGLGDAGDLSFGLKI
jgi:uracil phosphoribosyltransferase